MDSGFNDKGYSVTLTNVNLGSNPTVTVASTTINISGRDIYNTVIPGVFRINIAANTIPILSSAILLGDIEDPDTLEAIILYPGWGFILYNGNGNRFVNPTSGSWVNVSRFYFNDTNAPLLFSCMNNTTTYPESATGAIRIIDNNNTNFPVNCADAIQIFFRSNTSQVITGIRQQTS